MENNFCACDDIHVDMPIPFDSEESVLFISFLCAAFRYLRLGRLLCSQRLSEGIFPGYCECFSRDC